jgi:ribonucleoside-diphosphate reductase alpha chain
LIEVHPEFARIAKERGFYSEALMERIAFEGSVAHVEEVPEDIRELFVCAHDIPLERHVRMQAAFQAHVDNAISKTVNFPFEAPPEAVEKVYLLAWEQGCKGVTIYRDGSRETQVLETGRTQVVREGGQAPPVQAKPTKRKRPKVLKGTTIQMDTGCGPMYVTINEDKRGLFELFNTIGKAGGCAASQSEAIGRLVSLAWRSGIPAEETTKQLIGIRCHKPVGFGDNQITSCADAIAKAVLTHLGEDKRKYQDSPSYGACPECGGALEPKEGCATCKECGYSECE